MHCPTCETEMDEVDAYKKAGDAILVEVECTKCKACYVGILTRVKDS